MLKAHVNYSKKVPGDSQYSSQGYHLTLETEISGSDPAQIQSEISRTFALVRDAVETEIAGAGKAIRFPRKTGRTESGRESEKASNRQIKFITDLAGQRGIPLSELTGRIKQDYGASSLYDLTRRDATTVIDRLKAVRKAA